jgi:ubiquinone/menaquinone biosynthesis C-methylase UbiE
MVAGKAGSVADMRALPFDAGVFDVVWCSHVLEHIDNVDAAVAQVHRVLRVGGIAVLDVPVVGAQTRRLTAPGEHGHWWEPGRDWFVRYAVFRDVALHTPDKLPPEAGIMANSVVVICTK